MLPKEGIVADPEVRCIGPDVAEGDLGRLLHDVTELTRDRQTWFSRP